MTFKTKRDICGKTYYLRIDLRKKTYITNLIDSKGITVTQREFRKIKEELEKEGYKNDDR